jgi:hypothetical protein
MIDETYCSLLWTTIIEDEFDPSVPCAGIRSTYESIIEYVAGKIA